ncbi:SGNH hydrolase-type esterase domain-containing protein [Aspergillus pseudonomiae]|uniref:SGNH hydrolase-type esterase domain-containing protein n=1 Tax=Aspergillus pseudonomiae TaxID=1506151 RepID=A0A5N7DD73_9EURO|nr:SGNH hydrolase-type esterase domain-containing protein [Aspergillus pseudonomiae]KAE8404115.1 SGNH hydrolase-type esterase domain-containing protein [Aspergillus pseudonomiae]
MAQSYPLFALWLLLLSVVSSTAIPLRTGIFAPVKGGSVTTRADKVPLRILPLGASITWGVNSASGNGYRGPLRGKLTSAGWEVDMVGTKHHGNMKDDNVEAHSGDTIDQVKAAAQGSLKYKPNVVLINAGTNDCRRNISIPGAGERMRSLIESILKAEDTHDATIVLSTLIPSVQKMTEANRPNVNRQYRSLANKMQKDGVRIVLADMDPETDDDNNRLSYPKDYTTNGVADDTHPNEQGYAKMANVWYKAILEASDRGFIQ